MSLEQAFKRLAVQPSSPCRHCRRTFASSSIPRQQQSATASLMDSFQTPRQSSSRTSPAQTTTAESALNTSQAPSTPARSAGYDLARRAIFEATAKNKERQNRQAVLDLQREYTRKDLEQQVIRRWRVGDVYAPHDLSGVEMSKWKKQRRKPRPKFDVLDQLGINPIQHYKNFSMMSEYVTEMGKIKHSNDTSLRPVNQRRMAKAIRRAQGSGLLMPGVHRHPELLRIEQEARRPRY